jgi:processive 1,2-diacylglycerol beta-glucosyltransferase
VLFLTGGFATGDLAHSILGVWQERRDAQIVALCGRNERLRRRIAALPRPAAGVLQALGFVDRVSDVMSVADLVVTKSGGISTAELAALGKPVVVSGSIPGQEERNADALTEAGAAIRALTPEEVRWRVGQLLDDPDRLRDMARASKAFGRPNAAAEVADRIAGSVGVGGVARRPAFHGAF